MKLIQAIRLAVTGLVILIPFTVHSADAAPGKASTDNASLSAEEIAAVK